MRINIGRTRRWLIAIAAASVSFAVAATVPPSPVGAVAGPTACDRLAWSGSDGVTPQVWAANDDGTSRVSISNNPPLGSPTDNRSVFWSSDGSRIAWSGFNGTSYQIFISDPTGAGRTEISDLMTPNVPYDNGAVDWSPDDSKIAWSGHDGSNFQIYVANPDGSSQAKISVSPMEPTADPTRNRDPQWSPDGSQLAWSGVQGGTGPGTGIQQIWVANADGTNRRVVSSVGPGVAPTLNRYPQWSPDGTMLSWSGRDSSAVDQIFVANADGTNRHVISNVPAVGAPTANRTPRWSPGGTRVAWTGFDATSASDQIWVANADGTGRVALSSVDSGVDPIGNQHPEWSPDGMRVAWQGKVVTTEIFVADADGLGRHTISDVSPGTDPTVNQQPMWRHREVVLSLTRSVTPMVPGSSVSITVTVGTNCPTSDLVVSGVTLPCLGSVATSATVGTVSAGGVWTIGMLDGTATATLSGVVRPSGICTNTVTITSSSPPEPVPSTVVIGRVGADAIQPCDYSPTPFTDVAPTSFAFRDVACIYHLGITGGTTATTYSPRRTVTRRQMASFLARLWRSSGGSCDFSPTPFTDLDPDSFAFRDIACIYHLGITGGTTATTYSPADNVTREQMAAFLARLWRVLGGPCDSASTPFSDLETDSFSFDDVACIYHLGVTTGTGATTYSPANDVTREQMASFLARLWRSAAADGLRGT